MAREGERWTRTKKRSYLSAKSVLRDVWSGRGLACHTNATGVAAKQVRCYIGSLSLLANVLGRCRRPWQRMKRSKIHREGSVGNHQNQARANNFPATVNSATVTLACDHKVISTELVPVVGATC